MRSRSRPALLSVLLVMAVSVAVFASSSLALSDVKAVTEDPLDENVRPFDSLATSGSVRALLNQRGERTYRLDYRVRFTVGEDDPQSALQSEDGGFPDVVIRQSVGLPTLGDNEVDFVGPLALPVRSQQLALEVTLVGDCFTKRKSGFVFKFGSDCAAGWLSFGDSAFNVSDLLKGVIGRVWQVENDTTTVVARFRAFFEDPGYSFPIASLGDGSTMTFVVGQFGGTNEIGKVSFSG